jgi:short-subunit dehydrogenase
MPGDAKTGFTAKRDKSEQGDDAYKGAIERSVSTMEHDEQNGMPAAFVAKTIYRTATRKKAKTITTVGFKYKAFAVLAKLLPTGLVNKVIGSMYAK